jgi:hypothetical protein
MKQNLAGTPVSVEMVLKGADVGLYAPHRHMERKQN